MKNIIYIVPGLDPTYKDGASNRVNSFAKCFHEHGYKVTIVPLVHYHKYAKVRSTLKKTKSEYNWVLFPHLFFLKNPLINLWLYVEKLFILFLVFCKKPQYVLADYATGGYIASWTKMCSKLIVNHRGDMIDELIFNNNYPVTSAPVKTLQYYLKFAAKVADYNIAVSQNLKENIERRTGLPLLNTFIFPCCADVKRFSIRQSVDDSVITVGYIGGLSKWQRIDSVFDIFLKLQEFSSRYHLLLVTNSDVTPYKTILDKIGENNYTVVALPFNEVPNWLKKMDASFVLRDNRDLNIVASPTKISESLAAGVPLIVTPFAGDFKDICDQESCQEIRDEDSLEVNAQKVHNFMMEIMPKRVLVGKHCRELVETRTWQQYSDLFIEFIEKSVC